MGVLFCASKLALHPRLSILLTFNHTPNPQSLKFFLFFPAESSCYEKSFVHWVNLY